MALGLNRSLSRRERARADPRNKYRKVQRPGGADVFVQAEEEGHGEVPLDHPGAQGLGGRGRINLSGRLVQTRLYFDSRVCYRREILKYSHNLSGRVRAATCAQVLIVLSNLNHIIIAVLTIECRL